jgi:hypothetical protein
MVNFELFPIVGGLLLGSAIGYIRPALRHRVVSVVALILGTAATIISGEYRMSWLYAAVDVTLVLVFTALAFQTMRHVRPARR